MGNSPQTSSNHLSNSEIPFESSSLFSKNRDGAGEGSAHASLLEELVTTIRLRVKPWESNIQELFDFLDARRSGDTAVILRSLNFDGSFPYNDPVYGRREIPPWLLDLIDTAPMIRLAGVRQMTIGLTEFGAAVDHTRLSHSIGTALLALETANRLSLDPHETKLLTALALFHDIRHGPFSHIYDHVHIDGKKFDHDESSEDFLKARDVASALDRISLTPREIAWHLSASSRSANSPEGEAQFSPFGYLAKVILDRVDYAQRDTSKAAFLSARLCEQIRETSAALLEGVRFDRGKNLIVFPASHEEVLRDFVELRGYAFDHMAFDRRTQTCNALIRRELDRALKRVRTDGGNENDFLIRSTFMTDQELVEQFSDQGQRLIQGRILERALATLIIVDSADLTRTGREELRVPRLHEHMSSICGDDFCKRLDPLIVRVPRATPAMTFYLRSSDGSVTAHEMRPSSADDQFPKWNKPRWFGSPAPGDYGYKEIRICSLLGAESTLREGQERLQSWLREKSFIVNGAKVIADLDDLQR